MDYLGKNSKYRSLLMKIKLKLWTLEKSLIYYFPKKIAHKWYYKRRTGKKLNLNIPQDFNEKLQWLIVNVYGKNESKYADKLLVRNYVKQKGFGYILPKIYGVYNNPNDIKFDSLPKKFVLKSNHGSGEGYYLICQDKKKFDKKKAVDKLEKALKMDFSKQSLEYHYKYIERKVICEEYIESKSSEGLKDFKILCFHGKPEYILITSNRKNKLTRTYYDVKWNSVDLLKDDYKSSNSFDKPKQLEEMLHIAGELSKPFPFVRIDLYNEDGKIYFGEITLTPATGINETYSEKALNLLGKKIDLSAINNEKR